MIVYRLCKAKYSQDMSGQGARLSGGRWNPKGIPMVYTSQSRALCLAEIAVHIPLGNVPSGYVLVTIEIPKNVPMARMPDKKLPEGWKSFPYSGETQELGERFIRTGKYAVLRVPSAVVQDEYNFLINPAHPDAAGVKVLSAEPFLFDHRLFLRS